MDFIKYPKIKQLGDEETKDLLSNPGDSIVIEEKIDGANMRVLVREEKLILGSRTRTMDEDMEKGKPWKRAVEYIKMKFGEVNLVEYNNLLFVFENCIRHTMAYDWNNIPPVLGFDIYDMEKNRWMPYPQNKNIFNDIGFAFVPVLNVVYARDFPSFSDDEIPTSFYASPSAKDTQAEGVIFKNYNTQTFAKHVREKFREDSRKTFGGSKKYADNDTDRVCCMFCTNQRIDKIIFNLVVEGHTLDMKLMMLLPGAVYKDIMEEHWRDIVFSRYEINFHKLKKLVSQRCANVLKQVITNSLINK